MEERTKNFVNLININVNFHVSKDWTLYSIGTLSGTCTTKQDVIHETFDAC